jgi:hypothetical protein
MSPIMQSNFLVAIGEHATECACAVGAIGANANAYASKNARDLE